MLWRTSRSTRSCGQTEWLRDSVQRSVPGRFCDTYDQLRGGLSYSFHLQEKCNMIENGSPGRSNHYVGVAIGLVTDNADPNGVGRVKVKLPWLADSIASPWARLAVPGGGPNRGLFFVPEVNDEVLIAFEHGDPARP